MQSDAFNLEERQYIVRPGRGFDAPVAIEVGAIIIRDAQDATWTGSLVGRRRNVDTAVDVGLNEDGRFLDRTVVQWNDLISGHDLACPGVDLRHGPRVPLEHP